MAEMKLIIAAAKKRRAKYLKEFTRLGWTVTKYAESKGCTRARMSQLLLQAKAEV